MLRAVSVDEFPRKREEKNANDSKGHLGVVLFKR